MSYLVDKQTNPVEVRITTSPAQSVLAALSLLITDLSAVEGESWLKQMSSKLAADDLKKTKEMFARSEKQLAPRQEFQIFADYLDQVRRKYDAETTDHLRYMWRTYFRPEWERQHYLQSMADNLNSRDWRIDTAEEAVQAFLRRPVPNFIGRQLGDVHHLVFCLTPFIELQAAKFDDPHTLWIFVASNPRKLPMRYEPIQRTEVMRVASALADDSRLQILEMLAAFGPMRSQELIDKLQVSQPTVSRQLKQLKNTQFINEKRDGNASKIFELNPERLGEVMFMLETLLSTANARMVLNDVRLDQPAELRKFLNENGQVHKYSNKLNSQKLIIEYLAPKFEQGKRYTEKEVNELLNRWHTYKDPARLRRDLVDFGYVMRTTDGSQYWRE